MYEALDTYRLSDSTLSLFHSCPRKYQFQKVFKSRRRTESYASEVGQCLHQGYQTYLVTRNRDEAILAMMLAYPIHLETKWTKDRGLDACLSTLLSLFDASVSYDELVQIKDSDGDLVPAVEVPFEITILNRFSPNGNPVTYVGFIDAIMYDRHKGIHYVCDLKTHRLRIEDLSPKYKYANQCLPYGLVLSTILKKELTEFTVSYLTAFIDLSVPRIQEYRFRKEMQDIKEWGRYVDKRLTDIDSHNKANWFPRESSSCLAWGSKCQYFDVCQRNDNDELQRFLLGGGMPAEEKPFEPLLTIGIEL